MCCGALTVAPKGSCGKHRVAEMRAVIVPLRLIGPGTTRKGCCNSRAERTDPDLQDTLTGVSFGQGLGQVVEPSFDVLPHLDGSLLSREEEAKLTGPGVLCQT